VTAEETVAIPVVANIAIGKVLLIDDSVSAIGSPWYDEAPRWRGLISTLRKDLEATLGEARADELYDANDDRATILEEIRAAVGEESFRAATQYHDDGRGVTEQWILKLTDLGATVSTAPDRKGIEDLAGKDGLEAFLRSFNVILLDYEFLPDDQGAASIELAKLIAAAVQAEPSTPPPLLVKFSRLAPEMRDAERSAFAKDVHYPRGCYDFLAKDEVNHRTFAPLVAGLIENGEVGRRLYKVARTVSNSIATQVQDKVAEMLIWRLDPTSTREMFNNRLRPEGMSELDYLIEVTASLLVGQVRESEAVARDMRSFLDELARVPTEASPAETAGLAALEVALRFDRSVNLFRRPIDFGDIFLLDDGQTVGIVLTQQCDLMVRGKAGSEALGAAPMEWITICLGSLSTGDASPGVRFSSTGEPPFSSIEWDDQLVSLPRAILDLVTLDGDGRARLGEDDPTSEWWTGAYTEFISSQQRRVRKARGRATRRDKSRVLRLQGIAGDQRSAFGAGVDLRVTETGDLPFRRIGRMRWSDTLAQLQKVTTKAGRIGLMPDVGDGVTLEKVKVFHNNTDIGGLDARVTTFGGDATYVDVESTILRERLAGYEIFEPLVVATARYSARFNLLFARSMGFRFERQGKKNGWFLHPPK